MKTSEWWETEDKKAFDEYVEKKYSGEKSDETET